MRLILRAIMASLALAPAPFARATTLSSDGAYIRGCLVAAGNAYGEPPAVLVILLNVEGGRLGGVSPNTNGTVDIGPMQVNNIWLPKLAEHWATTRQAAYLALRDNFCASVEAGAWILRMGLDEAHGDFLEGVGFYHSHDPDYRRAYLGSVLRQALQLEAQAREASRPPPASSASPPTETEALLMRQTAPVHDRRKEGY
jgi:hypothetical protein